MTEWKQWLLTSVTAEFANKDLANVDFYYIAEKDGISVESLNVRFPDKNELIKTLIDEIADTHKEYITRATENIRSVRDRLVHFIVGSIEFVEYNPVLSNVIINCMYSTEIEIKEHIYAVYARVFELMEKWGFL